MFPQISIIIVTYNSTKYIRECIDSIKNQSYKNIEIILIDNNSKDKTLNIAKKYKFIQIIQNKENLGFSKANNQGIKIAKGKYVLFLNADVIITKDCINNLIKKLNSNPKIGFVVPKLLKSWNHNILDSTGIEPTKSRRFYDRGLMEIDSKQYDNRKDIFAGTGAAILFKKSALDDVRTYGEYLDEDFFAYVEDVDLCWRLRLKGWEGYYCPKACGYHQRGHYLERSDKTNLIDFLKKRKKQNKKDQNFKRIRRCVFRNNIWLLIKNDSLFEIARNFIPFSYYWTRRLGYSILFEPYVFKEVPVILGNIPKMLRKRKAIQKIKKIKHEEMRRFFKNGNTS